MLVYMIYIPHSALNRKDKHNGVILFIHGGGFENNTKEETECFAVRFAKLGFITADIEYSNCLDIYKEKSVKKSHLIANINNNVLIYFLFKCICNNIIKFFCRFR